MEESCKSKSDSEMGIGRAVHVQTINTLKRQAERNSTVREKRKKKIQSELGARRP